MIKKKIWNLNFPEFYINPGVKKKNGSAFCINLAVFILLLPNYKNIYYHFQIHFFFILIYFIFLKKMQFTLHYFLLFLVVIKTVHAIVGGKEVSALGEYPFIVSVLSQTWEGNRLKCGGVLLSPKRSLPQLVVWMEKLLPN